MKLSIEEFLQIRERQSQDDLKTLLAFVEHTLRIAPQEPAPPASDVPPVVAQPEPQSVVDPDVVAAQQQAAAEAAPKRSRTTKRSSRKK